jgi:isoquinoline 1-oxidoreductase beta subunit
LTYTLDNAALPTLDRRSFLQAGVALSGGLFVMMATPKMVRAATDGVPAPAVLNAYVRIAPDGHAFFTLARAEMGQGVSTSLAMLVAEELDVPLARIAVDQAPADIDRYGSQGTGGSRSIISNFKALRQAGATARAMLVAEAATRWGVSADSCTTRDAKVLHSATGRWLGYGDLAASAASRPVPQDVPLKNPQDFHTIGQPVTRLDVASRVNGAAVYGLDVYIPDMQVAVAAWPPTFGGKPAQVDDGAALAVKGVTRIVHLPDAVVVVARNSWAAMKGRDALKIVWEAGKGNEASDALTTALEAAVDRPGAIAAETAGQDKALASAPGQFTAAYHQPFLSHAPMEPMCCVAHVRDALCEIWTGTQVMGAAQKAVAAQLSIPLASVIIHNHPLGGSFGRRLESDAILACVAVARQLPHPVKLMWTREDDIGRDHFRPAYVDRIAAGLDKDGEPVAWLHRIAGSSIIARLRPDGFKGVDDDAVECAAKPIYRLPERRVEFANVQAGGIVTSWWRGVGALRSTFVLESFIDELARRAGKDPAAYRRALLDDKRLINVLDRVTEKAGWSRRINKGQGRGLAIQAAFGSFGAMVVDVTADGKGGLKVDHIVCSVDCGTPVNPLGMEAQVQGGALFGLSAALKSAVTFADGMVQQRNFDDYPVLRMGEVPKVEVDIVRNIESPGGLGELATILVAPALANAIHAATGRRLRRLPIGDQLGAGAMVAAG